MRPLLLALVLALSNPVARLDVTVQRAVQQERAPAYERVMRAATDLGRPAIMLGALLGVAVLGGPVGVEIARETLVAVVPANLVVEGLKHTVGRVRPDGDRRRSNSSFPSSHAANAFAIAAVFARRVRRLAVPMWLLAATVAWSRIYLNRHFLSDVVVGAVLGLACAWIAARWARGRDSRRGATGKAGAPGATAAAS
jgi:membrane-associated phospholipid phosphatase